MTAPAVEELVHVNVYPVSAGRQNDALYTGLKKALGKIFALLYAMLEIAHIAAFIQTRRQSHYVAARHTAVGVVAVAGYLLYLQKHAYVGLHAAVGIEFGELFPEKAAVAEGQHTAHVGVPVLFRRHCKAVAVSEHLACYLRYGLVGIAVLVHLYEVGVFGPARSVIDIGYLVFAGNAAHFSQVCHGHGLSADGVVGDAGKDKGHVLGACRLYQLLELFNIHVSLEGIFFIPSALRHLKKELPVIKIARHGAHLLYVALGRVEVPV